jgi:hypothetical protein
MVGDYKLRISVDQPTKDFLRVVIPSRDPRANLDVITKAIA